MPDAATPITVAIPSCNGAATIGEALRSVLAQPQGLALPVLVCDDRSDDSTREIVREVGGDRVEIVENSERLGLAGNWNLCAARSRTEFVAIFHQDDVMRPDHLAAHAAKIAEAPDLGWVASASGVVDEHGREVPATVVGRGGLGDRDQVFEAGEAVGFMVVENPLRCSAVTISVAAHGRAGGFDAAYRYVVDWDFWLRVARANRVAWLARPSVDVRWHMSSETHRFATGTADLEETSRLLDALGELARSQRHDADRRLSRAYLNRAHVALRAGDAELARRSLRTCLRLWPGILARIAVDPRLLVQMAAVGVSPRWAAAIFGR